MHSPYTGRIRINLRPGKHHDDREIIHNEHDIRERCVQMDGLPVNGALHTDARGASLPTKNGDNDYLTATTTTIRIGARHGRHRTVATRIGGADGVAGATTRGPVLYDYRVLIIFQKNVFFSELWNSSGT